MNHFFSQNLQMKQVKQKKKEKNMYLNPKKFLTSPEYFALKGHK